MRKKYLLTFSLAAISCLATKSLQSAFVNEEEKCIDVVSIETPVIRPSAPLIVAPEMNIH